MTRLLLVPIAVLGVTSSVTAQPQPQPYPTVPYYPPQVLMGNIYNPRTQPLSPYLNLFRGLNPAVDYYYGVRPGTVGGGSFGALGAPFTAGGGNRTAFFPQLSAAPDPLQSGGVIDKDPDPPLLPPAGHPVVFNNTMGYFPSPLGNRGGGSRPGLSGIGTTRPPVPKK
ncbi:MAG: hypothetical protein L0241_05765 [Planctomycetia bacterium]|nr:hypothetical protein [Planctomycetia bacterium]